jgi:hypothetical protein
MNVFIQLIHVPNWENVLIHTVVMNVFKQRQLNNQQPQRQLVQGEKI